MVPGLDNQDTVSTAPGPSPEGQKSLPAPQKALRGLSPPKSSSSSSKEKPKLNYNFPKRAPRLGPDGFPTVEFQPWRRKEEGDDGLLAAPEVKSIDSWAFAADQSNMTFLQICSTSDALSAHVSQFYDVPEPIMLNDTGIKTGYQRMKAIQPEFLWVSLCTKAHVPTGIKAVDFCYNAISGQYSRYKNFVFAYPWDGALWTQSKWKDVLTWPGVTCHKVNMSSWDTDLSESTGYMCLVVFGPSDRLHILANGPYFVSKNNWASTDVCDRLMTDLYPPSFCQAASMCMAYVPQTSWPCPEPKHCGLITDILDGLPDENVKEFRDCIVESLSVDAHVFSGFEVSTHASSVLVKDAKQKWLMTWLNARKNGFTCQTDDLSDRHREAIRSFRQMLFPRDSFKHAMLVRGGTATNVEEMVTAQKGVVVMWCKTDKVKQVYFSVLRDVDFRTTTNFNLSKWSLLMMYDPEGGVVKAGSESQPTPVDLRSQVRPDPGGSPPGPPDQPDEPMSQVPPDSGPSHFDPHHQVPNYSSPSDLIPPFPGRLQMPPTDQSSGDLRIRGTEQPRPAPAGPSPGPPMPHRGGSKRGRLGPSITPRRVEKDEPMEEDQHHDPSSSSRQTPVIRIKRERGRTREYDPPIGARPRREERSRSRDRDPDYRERSRSRDDSSPGESSSDSDDQGPPPDGTLMIGIAIIVCALGREIVFRPILSLFLEHPLQCTEHLRSF